MIFIVKQQSFICRFRRSLTMRPYKTLEQRKIIEPMGTRVWKEIGWDGMGHRTPVLTELGICLRYYYPTMVTEGGREIAAHYWVHWNLKSYGNDKTHADAVWDAFWVSLL
jgi:hypothetical protein